MRALRHQELRKIIISILLIGTAALIQWVLTPVIGEPSFIVFYPLVILASLYGNGSFAILSSALVIQYCFLPPQGQFFEKEWPGLVKQILFISSSLMIHGLTTALKHTLKQAKKMENRLQVTLNSIGDAVISTDADGKVDFLNPVAEAMTEWKWSDARGQSIEDILHLVDPVQRLSVELPVRVILEGQSGVRMRDQILVLGRNGRETIIEDSLAPIRGGTDDQNHLVSHSQGLVLAFRDVSEKFYKQKELEKVLKRLEESRDQFERVLENVLDGVVITDSEQRIVLWNPQAENMFGYSSGEALSQKVSELLKLFSIAEEVSSSPQSGARVQGQVLGDDSKRSMFHLDPHSLFSQRLELYAERKNQSLIALEVVLTPIQTSTGVCFFFFFKDLTLTREAEHALCEAHKKTELILSSAAEGILGLGRDGRITFVNPAAAQMLGWEETALIGQSLSQSIHDFNAHLELRGETQGVKQGQDKNSEEEGQEKRIQCPISESLTKGVISHREDEEFRRRDGTRFPVEYSSTPMRAGQAVVGLVLTFRDISERKKSEHQILGLMNQLQEALSSRDEFISIASHELKTPLTSLKLHYQLIARQLSLGDTRSLDPTLAQARIESTNRQIDRMVRLIDDMLDVSRISSGRLELVLEEIDLSRLMKLITERYLDHFKSAQCPFTLELPDSLMCVCDGLRVEQVLVNLFMNAFKYAAGKPIEIRLKTEKSYAVIEVQDHGIGIPEEKKSTIFEKFERAISSRYISGFGLGLYICQKIVESHHGKIQVETRLGEGSCFKVLLPLQNR